MYLTEILAKAKADKESAESEVVQEVELTEKQKVHQQLVDILVAHDSKESTIPLDNPYWGLVNKYRGMV